MFNKLFGYNFTTTSYKSFLKGMAADWWPCEKSKAVFSETVSKMTSFLTVAELKLQVSKQFLDARRMFLVDHVFNLMEFILETVTILRNENLFLVYDFPWQISRRTSVFYENIESYSISKELEKISFFLLAI